MRQGEATVDVASQAVTQAPATCSASRYEVLAILTVVCALSFLDRPIFNVPIEPIKKEFALGALLFVLAARTIRDDIARAA